jgi:hypothetical protein
MMKRLAILCALTLIAACGSSNGVRVIEPEIRVHTVEIPVAQPQGAAQFSTVVKIDVANRSGDSIRIERITLSSVGVGPYNIAMTDRDFHRAISPDQFSTFEVWARAVTPAASDETLVPQEGPIVIRGMVEYSHAGGAGRKVFVQRVPTTFSKSGE